MRKLSFIIALLLCVNISFAQKGKVTSAVSFFTQGKLDKAKELIDEAIGHENCVNWAKAYMVRGQIYQAIFETQDENYKKLSKDPLSVAWDSYQKVIQLDDKNKFEKEANTFAIELLVPDTEIVENPDLTIGQLARMTGYSEELLKCKNIFIDNTP